MSRITVTPADEDEVIYVGSPAGAGDPERDVRSLDAPASVSENSSTSRTEGLSGLKGERPANRPQVSSPSANEPARKVAADGKGGTRADSFQETTLDDLERSEMPFAQKIVIVAAVVCIIGALVYYFVAMR